MTTIVGASLDHRRAAFRDDLADARLEGRVEANRFVTGQPRQVIAMPGAGLRRAPRFDAPLDTEALTGETLLIFEEDEGWAWAQLDRDDYVGYMPANALGAVGAAATHRVAARATWVYAAPHIKSPTLGWLSLNARIAGEKADDRFVRTREGGFVFASHVAPIDDAEGDFVEVAERLVGAPYLWGGRTSIGLDCSGLVQLALEAAQRPCPRDSDMQMSELGEPVIHAPGSLQRGDLVFWRGHVGVMIDADLLLHANAHHMRAEIEPLTQAAARIAAHGPVTAVRRIA